jgi:hypothetical protein
MTVLTLSAPAQINDINNKKQKTGNTTVHAQNKKTTTIVKHHVVIQVSSGDTAVWKAIMNNIKHLKDSWGDSVQIEVVVHGPGIDMLVTAKTTQQKRIIEFKQMGVAFAGCENTLRQRNISKADIIPEAGFVPSGVAEIIMKQEQGWSYLKAGF